jgi:hypothetical protein
MRSRLSLLLWFATIGYIAMLLLAPPNLLPGEPVWAIRPETIDEVLGESLNFFFVLPLLNAIGVHLMEAATLHPASEAFFNFSEAWIFMFLPLLWADAKGDRLPRTAIWGGAMFLTNIFLMPYMALRLRTETADVVDVVESEIQSEIQSEIPPEIPPESESGIPSKRERTINSQNTNLIQPTRSKGTIAQIFGWVGIVVGSIAVSWVVFARPEFGSLTDRGAFWLGQLTHDRVTLAFFCDIWLFWVFQIWLIGDIEPLASPIRNLRWLPFWGLAFWLVL